MDDSTPIALIGVACRVSGDANSPERLWKICAEGRSGWSRIPLSRFNLDDSYHPKKDIAGTVFTMYIASCR